MTCHGQDAAARRRQHREIEIAQVVDQSKPKQGSSAISDVVSNDNDGTAARALLWQTQPLG
ncbi:protein of unknown function [Pseudomonas sp. JV551A1]|nr:protein of unknown function [Pseudomonas sp. JV551A1]